MKPVLLKDIPGIVPGTPAREGSMRGLGVPGQSEAQGGDNVFFDLAQANSKPRRPGGRSGDIYRVAGGPCQSDYCTAIQVGHGGLSDQMMQLFYLPQRAGPDRIAAMKSSLFSAIYAMWRLLV